MRRSERSRMRSGTAARRDREQISRLRPRLLSKKITVRQRLYNLRIVARQAQPEDANVPIEFLANKADLKDEMDVTEADIRRTAEAHHAPYLFTSAKTGQNVEDAFAKLAKMIASHSS